MPRGKQSGIAFGQRTKQKGQSDIDILIRLKQHLYTRWHLNFHREWYVGFNRGTGSIERIVETVDRSDSQRFKWRNPDLLCIHRRRGLIIIEVDGAVHDRKVADTERRNEEFRQGNAKVIVLNLREIKDSGKSIEEDLDWKMTKLLSGAPIGTG